MKPIIVNGRYQVKSKLGEGGFGLVYDGMPLAHQVAPSHAGLTRAGDDILSNEEVAIKLVHRRDDPRILEDEASIYRALAGGPGIPQELLGLSLEDLFNFCGRRFSLKTVLLVADQAISRIKYIHDKHYLHHDIKPDNFLMGVGRRGNVLYTIDFGLAQEFSGLASEGRSHGRTLRYASINNHNKRILLYFIRGSLPWQGCKAASEEEKDDLIKDMKTNSSPRNLCEGLPEEFAIYLGYVRSLGFEDRPVYAYLHRLFNRLFVSLEFKHDNVFDWTEKRFNELHGLVAAS
ncbi:hypothetical protein ACCO45_012745 [Purpureocillium lilacinum]|uniref:Uncharacterized protein n=1 Tax=Purpureocillium lilacinum TaxID=33203 RepID=A0ACC4DAF4_PURLI